MAAKELTQEALESLLAPFSPEHLHWQKVEEELDHARFVRVLSRAALFERLDDVLEGQWSLELSVVAPLPPVVLAHLTLGGQRRGGIGEGLNLREAESLALSQAALAYGMAFDDLHEQSRWERSDWRPEAPTVRSAALESAQAQDESLAGPGDPPPAPPPPPEPEKPQAHHHIDDMMEKLGNAGMGLEGNRIMMRYGGYGKTLEDSRKLFKELRELLHKGGA